MSRPAISVRRAGTADVAELSALAQRTWSDAFGHAFTPEDQTADAAARRSEAFFTTALEDSVILLAVAESTFVGYAKFGAVEIPEADAGPGDRELHRLYVESSRHRSGIGATLLSAALAHPDMARAERVFLNVWAENVAAMALYRRFGFTQVGTSPYRIGSAVVEDALLMRPRQALPPAYSATPSSA